MIHSLSISGLLTMELHALNNEGAEGNTMMTRMVDIILPNGGDPSKHTVNAVSGDMFKHMLVEHLLAEAQQNALPLCASCAKLNANRICADEGFMKTPGWDDKTPDSIILGKVLETCAIDDCAGILITGKIGKERSIARKSCVEFGWVVGKPGAVTTDSYFHAKYVPEGREKGSGAGENLGQNIFHRPASSGQYAVVANVDLYKVGRNDITLTHAVKDDGLRKRQAALLRSLTRTFVKPTGAHRNTQHPHIVGFEGVVATSATAVPAPVVSALNPSYSAEMQRIAASLNKLSGAETVRVLPFDSLAAFTEVMVGVVGQIGA